MKNIFTYMKCLNFAFTLHIFVFFNVLFRCFELARDIFKYNSYGIYPHNILNDFIVSFMLIIFECGILMYIKYCIRNEEIKIMEINP